MKRPDVPYYYKDDQWFFSEGCSGLDELQGNIEEWVNYSDYLESILKEWYKDVIKNTPDDADWWDNVEDRLACKIIRWIQNEVK